MSTSPEDRVLNVDVSATDRATVESVRVTLRQIGRVFADTDFPFAVTLTHSEDGTPIVDITTTGPDAYPGYPADPANHDVPYLRVYVNDDEIHDNPLPADHPARQR